MPVKTEKTKKTVKAAANDKTAATKEICVAKVPATKKCSKKAACKCALEGEQTVAKVPATKKCSKKVACKCALEGEQTVAKAMKSEPSRLTRIIVKYNVGWGNQLYIRGIGAGLSWTKGVLMQCVGEDEWLWEQLVSKGGLKFKILVNDEIWNADEDSAVEAGETVIFHPNF